MANYRYDKLFIGDITAVNPSENATPVVNGATGVKTYINQIDITCIAGNTLPDNIQVMVDDGANKSIVKATHKQFTSNESFTIFKVGGSGIVLLEGHSLIVNCPTANGSYTTQVYGAKEDI